jgi:hypothetical protein
MQVRNDMDLVVDWHAVNCFWNMEPILMHEIVSVILLFIGQVCVVCDAVVMP